MGDRTCTEPGCDAGYYCRDYCMKHYNWHKRQGHIENLSTDAVVRFWLHVDKNGPLPPERPELGNCWIFAPHRRGSYRGFTFNNIKQPAHRYGYELQVGQIPQGLVIDHLCRVPSCIRGTHLEAVPQRINIERGQWREAIQSWMQRGAKITHCPSGHEYTAENAYISPRGSRACRACNRIKTLASKYANLDVVRARDAANARRRRAAARAAKTAA